MSIKKIIFIFIISLLVAACGKKASPTPEVPMATITPDLCSSENLPGEAAKVNKLTREFDDYSSLASNTPQAQLVQVIPQLQRVLRDSEDQQVPVCLVNLKKLQLAHMNTVVQTLLAFMGSSDTNLVNQGIAQARQLHNQYDIELARLLGITLVPRPTDSAQATPDANVQLTEAPVAQATPQVVNPGSTDINLRSAPDVNATTYATLIAGQFALANGRTEDGQWIRVEVPNQPGVNAWVYAQLVQLSIPIEQLPAVNP